MINIPKNIMHFCLLVDTPHLIVSKILQSSMRQYICQKMNHSLSNPNHLRRYEVQVENKHAILVRKVDMDDEFDLVAKFKSQGIIIYIDT